MIPFCTPENGTVINLSQIIKLRDLTTEKGPLVEVTFTNGSTARYSGDAAKTVKSDVIAVLSVFRSHINAVLAEMQRATSPIITADKEGLIQ